VEKYEAPDLLLAGVDMRNEVGAFALRSYLTLSGCVEVKDFAIL